MRQFHLCNCTLQVQLVGESLQVSLNMENVTDTVAGVGDTNNDSSLVILERISESSIDLSFRNGISLAVSVSFGLLSFVATIPQQFQGNTSGLLGNFNDDSSDDFIFRDGPTIDVDSPDRLIHNFGQSCKCSNYKK